MATFDNAIPYIKKAEGGLSRAATDSASKFPSPYTYNGQTGWHTNKGVTYKTFKNLAPKLGYEDNSNNFLTMPDSIWLRIYKNAYWDAVAGDKYNSQAIANAVVDFAWASGTGGAEKSLIKFLDKNGITAKNFTQIATGFNALVQKHGEGKTFSNLIDHRKAYFVSLNQPANQKGWLDRMDTLKNQGLSLIGKGVDVIKAHPILTTVLTATILFSAYFLIFSKTTKTT